MLKLAKEIATGLYSLLVGMWITLRFSFFRPVTVKYPRQSLRMTPRYRGHIELTRDPSTGKPKCVVCMLCQRACPSGCIALEGHKPEGATKRELSKYALDFTTCSLCGLCVESCKFDALVFSKEYNLASVRKEDYAMDLLRRGKEESP